MAIKQPNSMDECIYFTRRSIDKGQVKAWVFKELCPKCKKSLMSKPRNPKTGKTKIRAKEYVCPVCNNIVQEEEYEGSLTANVEYTCPQCDHKGETQTPFKRKKVRIFDEELQKKITVETLRFSCQKCGKNIDITKKMK